MSERVKPTQLRAVQVAAPGEVIEAEHERTGREEVLAKYRAKVHRGSEILSIPPRSWFVRGWLAKDSLAALYAPSGVGKSFYAVTLGLEFASGGRWCGERLQEETVLYIAAERATDVRDRMEAWSKYHGREIPERFVLLDGAPQLTDKKADQVNALADLIQENDARIVILDTYARMTLGIEENSSKETGPVLDRLDLLRKATNGGLVLVVHHTPKSDPRTLRGSSAFLGAVDLAIQLTNENGLVKSEVSKSNAGREPLPEWYKLEPIELPPSPGEVEKRSLAVLEYSGPPPADELLEEKILEILAGGALSKKELLAELEVLADSGKIGKPPHAKTLERALKHLASMSQITKTGNARLTKYSLPATGFDSI